MQGTEQRGEFTLVIEGAREDMAGPGLEEEQVREAVLAMRAGGMRRKTVAQVLQLLTPLSRNEAYRRAGLTENE